MGTGARLREACCGRGQVRLLLRVVETHENLPGPNLRTLRYQHRHHAAADRASDGGVRDFERTAVNVRTIVTAGAERARERNGG